MTKKSMSTLFTALFLLLAEAALILLLSYPVIRPGEVYSPDLDALSGRYGHTFGSRRKCRARKQRKGLRISTQGLTPAAQPHNTKDSPGRLPGCPLTIQHGLPLR